MCVPLLCHSACALSPCWKLILHQETYTFPVDVRLYTMNDKRSIMALYNPSSRENFISKMFAEDLGFPIPEPPNKICVIWSSSSLRRFNEKTTFVIAGPASFKLLFGREVRTLRQGASPKNRSLETEKGQQPRAISFMEGMRIGLLYQLELDDSDESEAGILQRGPTLADVEGRLQSDRSEYSTVMQKYLKDLKEVEQVDSTMDGTVAPITDTLRSARTHQNGLPFLESGGLDRDQGCSSPRKPALSTGSTTTPSVQGSAGVQTNRYAVLGSLDSSFPSKPTTSSKKPKKKRKTPSKKLGQNSGDPQRSIPDQSLPMTVAETQAFPYTPRYIADSNSKPSSSHHLFPPKCPSPEPSSESRQGNYFCTDTTSPVDFSKSLSENYISFSRGHHRNGEDVIPRSSKAYQDNLRDDRGNALHPEIPESSRWRGLKGAHGTNLGDDEQRRDTQGRSRRKTESKKRK